MSRNSQLFWNWDCKIREDFFVFLLTELLNRSHNFLTLFNLTQSNHRLVAEYQINNIYYNNLKLKIQLKVINK